MELVTKDSKPQQSAVLSLLQQAASETQQLRAELLALQLSKHVSKRTSINFSVRASVATDDAASRASQQALELQEPTGERRAPPRAPDETVADLLTKPLQPGLRMSQGHRQLHFPAGPSNSQERTQLPSLGEQPQPDMPQDWVPKPRTSSDISNLARPLNSQASSKHEIDSTCEGIVSLLLSPRTTQERLQDQAMSQPPADMPAPKLRPAASIVSQANSESVLMGSPMAPAQSGTIAEYVAKAVRTPHTLFSVGAAASMASPVSRANDGLTRQGRADSGMQLITKDKGRCATPTKHVASPRAGPANPLSNSGVGIAAKLNPAAGQQHSKVVGLRGKLGMAPVRTQQQPSKPAVTAATAGSKAPVTKLDVLARLQKANEAFKKMHPDATSSKAAAASQISGRAKPLAGKQAVDVRPEGAAAVADGVSATARQQLYMKLLKRAVPTTTATPADRSHLASKPNSTRLDPASAAVQQQDRPTARTRSRHRNTAVEQENSAAAGFVIVRRSVQSPQQLSAGGAVTSVSLQQFLAQGTHEHTMVAGAVLQQPDNSAVADMQQRSNQASMGKVFESLVAMHARGGVSPFKARYADADTAAAPGAHKPGGQQLDLADGVGAAQLYKALHGAAASPLAEAGHAPLARQGVQQSAAHTLRAPSVPKQPNAAAPKRRTADKRPSSGGGHHAADGDRRRATSAPAKRGNQLPPTKDSNDRDRHGRKQSGRLRSPRSTGTRRVEQWDTRGIPMDNQTSHRLGAAKSPWLAHELVDEPDGHPKWLTTCVGPAPIPDAIEDAFCHDGQVSQQHTPAGLPGNQQHGYAAGAAVEAGAEPFSASPGMKMATYAVAAAAVLAGRQKPVQSMLGPPAAAAAYQHPAAPAAAMGASSVLMITPSKLSMDGQLQPHELYNTGTKPTDGVFVVPQPGLVSNPTIPAPAASRRAMSPSLSHVSGRLSRPTHEDLALSEMSVIIKKGTPAGPKTEGNDKDLAGLSPEEVLRRTLRRTGPAPRASPVRPYSGTHGLAPHLAGARAPSASKPRGYAAAAAAHASPGSRSPHYAAATASSAAKLSPVANLSPNQSKACLGCGTISPSPSKGPLTPRDFTSPRSVVKQDDLQSVRQVLHWDGHHDGACHDESMTPHVPMAQSPRKSPARPHAADGVTAWVPPMVQEQHMHAASGVQGGGSTVGRELTVGIAVLQPDLEPHQQSTVSLLPAAADAVQQQHVVVKGDACLVELVSQLMQDHATEVAALGLDQLSVETAPAPHCLVSQQPRDKGIAGVDDGVLSAAQPASAPHVQDEEGAGDCPAAAAASCAALPLRPSVAALSAHTTMTSSGRCCIATMPSSQGRSLGASPRSSRSSAADMLAGGYASRLHGGSRGHVLPRSSPSGTPALTATAEEPVAAYGVASGTQQTGEVGLDCSVSAHEQETVADETSRAGLNAAHVYIADTSHGLKLLQHLPAGMTAQQLLDALAAGLVVQTGCSAALDAQRGQSMEHTAAQHLYSPPQADGCMGCFAASRRNSNAPDIQEGAAVKPQGSSLCKVVLAIRQHGSPVLCIKAAPGSSVQPRQGVAQEASREIQVLGFVGHQPEQQSERCITVMGEDGTSVQLTCLSAHDHAALVLGLNTALLIQTAASSGSQVQLSTQLHALPWSKCCA